MTDFCDFVPDDPSCQTSDTIIDGGDFVDGVDGRDVGFDEPVDTMDDDQHDGGDHQDMDDHDMMPMGRMDSKMTWEEVDEWLDLWLQQGSGW